jgi:hypothetical protein
MLLPAPCWRQRSAYRDTHETGNVGRRGDIKELPWLATHHPRFPGKKALCSGVFA